jgi:hypothetical protein
VLCRLLGDRLRNALQVALGRRQQRLALARPLLGQRRIAAGDETLAGEVGRADLGQVALVEQAHLQRPDVGGQRGDLRRPEAADPVESGRHQLLRDPRRGDHATVAYQRHVRQPEAPLQLVDLVADRLRVGGVALEHLHRHRRAVRRTQEAVHDLRPVGTMVAAVAVPGERAAAALQVARCHVVEHQRAIDEVLLRQRRLDARLLPDQPVERFVHLPLGHLGETQRQRQARGRRLGRQRAVQGELRSRRDDPLDDHRFDQVANAPLHLAAALQRAVEPQFANRGAHRPHVAVAQAAHDLEAGLPLARHLAALQQPGDAVDQRRRQLRQVRQRALLHAPALAIALAQQDRRRRFPVRDRIDEHGLANRIVRGRWQGALHGHIVAEKIHPTPRPTCIFKSKTEKSSG